MDREILECARKFYEEVAEDPYANDIITIEFNKLLFKMVELGVITHDEFCFIMMIDD